MFKADLIAYYLIKIFLNVRLKSHEQMSRNNANENALKDEFNWITFDEFMARAVDDESIAFCLQDCQEQHHKYLIKQQKTQ